MNPHGIDFDEPRCIKVGQGRKGCGRKLCDFNGNRIVKFRAGVDWAILDSPDRGRIVIAHCCGFRYILAPET